MTAQRSRPAHHEPRPETSLARAPRCTRTGRTSPIRARSVELPGQPKTRPSGTDQPLCAAATTETSRSETAEIGGYLRASLPSGGHAAPPLVREAKPRGRSGAEPAELAPQRRRAIPKGCRLPGREAERLGVGPAIVLGQDVAGLPGPVRDGAAADLAACNRKMRHGYREAAGTCSAHHVNHASSADVTAPLSMRHTPAMRQISASGSGQMSVSAAECRAREPQT